MLFGDPSVTLLFSQQISLGYKFAPYPQETPVHASAGKCHIFNWKLNNAHAFIQSLSVETLAMSCISTIRPPSALLKSQRISKERDD